MSVSDGSWDVYGRNINGALPRLQTLPTFIAGFTPMEYVLDGIIQRSHLYSLTALTGHGKTAVVVLLAALVAAFRSVGPINTYGGRVVFLAGENPDDLRLRLCATCQILGLDPNELPIDIMPGSFQLNPENADFVRDTINLGGETALIIADTAAAYFDGDNDNDNVQQGTFARTLRVLVTCTGKPAVLVPCHPIKRAAQDNLLPRGGGSFMNEVDGNLTLWSQDIGKHATLHWQGKIRGPDFQPVDFQLRPVPLRGFMDAHGRAITSIAATYQDQTAAERVASNRTAEENTVLELLRRHPGISVANLARNAGWLSDTDNAQPLKSKVHRLLDALKHDRLVRLMRGKWRITKAGIDELEEGQK